MLGRGRESAGLDHRSTGEVVVDDGFAIGLGDALRGHLGSKWATLLFSSVFAELALSTQIVSVVLGQVPSGACEFAGSRVQRLAEST